MTPQVNIPDAATRGVIYSLRSPCAQNATLKRGYSTQNPRQLGQVHVIPSTSEPVIAPGSGTVTKIFRHPNTAWSHEAGTLDTHQTLEIRIDHGSHISTTIHGLSDINVVVGQYVTRGDTLGTALTTEIFFQLFYLNSPLDPGTYTNAFRGYDGARVTGKSRKLRAGPDFISRGTDDTVSYLSDGIRYFVDKYCTDPPLLVNIDFNGVGSKQGLAATGSTSTDFWNSYAPIAFTVTFGTSCNIVPRYIVDTVGDDSDETVTFSDGSIFDTVIPSDTEFDSGTNSVAFLDGSLETVPEVDDGTLSMTVQSGAILEVVISSSGTDYSSTSLAWSDGTLAEITITTSGTEDGTFALSWSSGSLFDAVIYVLGTNTPDVSPFEESGGTTVVDFISGSIDTILFPVSHSDDSSGTLAWLSGAIS